jgi:ADP-L-glycero-D-manno-heptose 6-epimerase
MTAEPGPEVLVTGAAGFIGSHIVRACHGAGYQVAAVDIRPLPPGVRGLAHPVADSADDAVLLRQLRAGRYSAVIHQAAITSTLEKDWELLREVNIRQPVALARVCADGGVPFIYASSHSVYGKIGRRVPVAEGAEYDPAICSGPVNLYARSKLALDEAMAALAGTSQLAWAGIRYTNVFGPGESHKGNMASIISQLLQKAALGLPITLFADTLDACRDYIPAEDVADTILLMLGHQVPAGLYNLGSGQPVSFAALLQWCAEFGGTDPEVELVANPVQDAYQYWTCADLTRLEERLPGFRRTGAAGVRSAAERLFRRYQSAAG